MAATPDWVTVVLAALNVLQAVVLAYIAAKVRNGNPKAPTELRTRRRR